MTNGLTATGYLRVVRKNSLLKKHLTFFSKIYLVDRSEILSTSSSGGLVFNDLKHDNFVFIFMKTYSVRRGDIFVNNKKGMIM